MTYYYEDLIPQVRMRLNLPSSEPSFPASFKSATLPLDDLIATLIEESAREATERMNPADCADPEPFSVKPDWRSDNDCAVALPDDFLHLVAFRMTGWEQTATRLILPGDPDYGYLSSPFRFVRGTPQRPRCYLLNEFGARKLIACSSERREEEPQTALYIPLPTSTGYGRQRHIRFPETLAGEVIRLTAGKALEILSL